MGDHRIPDTWIHIHTYTYHDDDTNAWVDTNHGKYARRVWRVRERKEKSFTSKVQQVESDFTRQEILLDCYHWQGLSCPKRQQITREIPSMAGIRNKHLQVSYDLKWCSVSGGVSTWHCCSWCHQPQVQAEKPRMFSNFGQSRVEPGDSTVLAFLPRFKNRSTHQLLLCKLSFENEWCTIYPSSNELPPSPEWKYPLKQVVFWLDSFLELWPFLVSMWDDN